ncbi:MAG TPA: uroporphyrinogen decarboxylase family protein [Candidatus Hydrogenedentes bacterium]|nr:uroporphyrinogen decarboxylase family protein [Candidatus Hydrogenedentota bacterium]HOL76066.1 uroporphyrinogen decarboxylase family protein [Candidatus Hydrogenedentota bacterium]HPO84680.1 uroporphyrinogen decarboxylase family protein [Candidatus Hydrogenedentota bacterium]
MSDYFEIRVEPDWQGLLHSIQRTKPAERVHFVELFLDAEVQDTLCDRFGLLSGLSPADPAFSLKKEVRLQSFLGYDYVRCKIDPFELPLNRQRVEDTAALKRTSGRDFVDETQGPITNWEEFEQYPWPDPRGFTTNTLEWYEENLPDTMCIIGSGFGHFAEYLTWLMGYTTFCNALLEQRDLVSAIYEKIRAICVTSLELITQFSRVKAVWASDDMGFRGGLLMSPADMREFVLRGHKELAELAHNKGLPYLLHSCGNLSLIMDELLDFVKIDAKHSFEDTIEKVTDVKHTYGQRIALLGGIDVDFLCRATPDEVRKRVRYTLDICMPGGGYCLGTGNSVANYIPLENYLVMLDEGRRYCM